MAKALTLVRALLSAAALFASLGGCTTEPLVSRKGVSPSALGQLGIQALLGMGRTNAETHFDEDVAYVAGIIPVNQVALDQEMDRRFGKRIDNGTRLSVNGRQRGFLPLVTTLPKPGPHQVRLEIPVFEPFTMTLGDPIRLQTAQGEIDAWPPVIVHMLTGEVYTTKESSAVDVDRNTGTRRKTDIAKEMGRHPLLIVTTTDKTNSAWRKIGQMRVQGRAGPHGAGGSKGRHAVGAFSNPATRLSTHY
jgi:hypothetical protein